MQGQHTKDVTQQQRPESPGIRVNTRCINPTKGTPSKRIPYSGSKKEEEEWKSITVHLPSATDTRERRITVKMPKNVSPPDRISDLTRIWEIGYVTTLTKDNVTTSKPVSLRNDVGTWSGVGKKTEKKEEKKKEGRVAPCCIDCWRDCTPICTMFPLCQW